MDDEEGEGEVDGDFQTIGKGGKTLNLTAEGTYKTLREIFESRGKKVSLRHMGAEASGSLRQVAACFGQNQAQRKQ